jgi:hypothetical protein
LKRKSSLAGRSARDCEAGVRRKKPLSSNLADDVHNTDTSCNGNRRLRSLQKNSTSCAGNESSDEAISAPCEDLYELNINAMVSDIGDQNVPVVGPEYDEKNPTRNKMKMEEFLKSVWSINSPDLYLHQWQFPLAKREVRAAAKD